MGSHEYGNPERKEQGLQQGLQKGQAKLLRRQLTRRVGPLPS
jgi:hypothetical protein